MKNTNKKSNRNAKRLSAVLLTLLMVISAFAIAGCQGTVQQGSSGTTQETQQSTDTSTGTSTTDTDIGEAKAKEIALAKVSGATESDIRSFEREIDDGRLEYEGEIIYNNYEYDFTIDGTTGSILSWEVESIYG